MNILVENKDLLTRKSQNNQMHMYALVVVHIWAQLQLHILMKGVFDRRKCIFTLVYNCFKMSQLKMRKRCVLILTHFHLVFCNLPLKYAILHVACTFQMYAFFLSKTILSYSACCWHPAFVRIISCNVKREKKIKSALIIWTNY